MFILYSFYHIIVPTWTCPAPITYYYSCSITDGKSYNEHFSKNRANGINKVPTQSADTNVENTKISTGTHTCPGRIIYMYIIPRFHIQETFGFRVRIIIMPISIVHDVHTAWRIHAPSQRDIEVNLELLS